MGDASREDQALLGHLLLTAGEVARELGLQDGFRLVMNHGKNGGETVPHLHCHLLGGRPLSGLPVEMTLPNQITILRILMVPAFIVTLLYYVHGGGEWLRWLSLAIFALAALSDAVDGFIAQGAIRSVSLAKFWIRLPTKCF